MKCISCEIEINPKWKHAIDINVCPFCGKHIMEEHLKNLLTSLGETMEKLQAYPEQLSDWLLSNYNFIKTDSPNLKQFLPKEAVKELKRELEEQEFQEKKTTVVKIKTPDGGEQEVVVEKAMSEDKANKFFDRAEVLTASDLKKKGGPKSVAEKTQYLKNLKAQIESEGSQGIVNEAGLASMIAPEAMENADPEAVAALQSLISENDITSSLPPTMDDEDEMTNHVLAMNLASSKGKKPQGGGYNEQDARSLLEMQKRVNQSRRNFESGENRGGKGGGFSRA